jgi:hypothetical protein
MNPKNQGRYGSHRYGVRQWAVLTSLLRLTVILGVGLVMIAANGNSAGSGVNSITP